MVVSGICQPTCRSAVKLAACYVRLYWNIRGDVSCIFVSDDVRYNRMDVKKHIYIVTSGEYSDYRIDGCFTLEKDALKYIKCFLSQEDVVRVEKHLLNPVLKEMNKDYKCYFVRMNKDGDVDELYQTNFDGASCLVEYRFDRSGCLYLDCLARDEKHAVKIVNEKRIQILAMNLWNKRSK